MSRRLAHIQIGIPFVRRTREKRFKIRSNDRTFRGVSAFNRIKNATRPVGYEQPHEPAGSEVSNPSIG
jgi:hypothetical protein